MQSDARHELRVLEVFNMRRVGIALLAVILFAVVGYSQESVDLDWLYKN